MSETLSTSVLLADAAEQRAWRAKLRGAGPVHRITTQSGETGWLIVGHEEARNALVDLRLQGRTATVGHGRRMPEDLERALNSHMLNVGPPDHTRLRRLVSAAFTRRRIEQMRPRIQELTDELLDGLAGADEADLVAGLALPLPMRVLVDLFGIPAEDCADFNVWTKVLTSAGAVDLDRLTTAAGEMVAYLRGLLDRKRQVPESDLLSALVAVRDGADRLSDDELTSMVYLLLTAGYETTVNLIGNGLLNLLANPEQLVAFKADPDLLPQVVEEAMRFDSPVQIAVRHSTEPVEIAGQAIPSGALILVSLLWANRDPDRFTEPEVFRVDRQDNPQLGFGYGFHHCIGAPLARMEGTVAIGTVIRRFPALRLAHPASSLTWRASMVMHGLTALPVHLR
ncbi:cytochrome P450 family protein [Salinispora arenicola]|uniref:Cytochrome P450 n=1 Tax=Salinispora arenicola TaxID=168697 RepID=A0A542XTC7_SALAC|nr:cytochrome P450 [Salinispora arenicola]TQL39097.1 cytochrome P450 [Salinispora arenicola]GIM88008.1 cytochrome P450 [Salinispora arenicola]